jgi:hypothetical protein
MNATVAALLGSLVGALAALAGAVVSSVVALKNERRSEESKAHTAYVDALRERSGAAFTQLFVIVQAIEWIAWYAVNDPTAINDQRIKSYEDTVNRGYEALLGAMAMTASLNLQIYEEMRPVLSKLYKIESQIGSAIREKGSDRSAATQVLRTCRSDAVTLRDELPPELNRIMMLAETADRRQKARSI